MFAFDSHEHRWREYASAFRVMQSGILRPWNLEAYRVVDDVDGRCMQGCCDRAAGCLGEMSSHSGHTVNAGACLGAPQAV